MRADIHESASPTSDRPQKVNHWQLWYRRNRVWHIQQAVERQASALAATVVMHGASRTMVERRQACRELGLIDHDGGNLAVIAATQQAVALVRSLHTKGKHHARRETPAEAVHATAVRRHW